MEKKSNTPESLLKAFFAFMFAKGTQCIWPQLTRDRKTFEDRQIFIDTCMKLSVKDYPPQLLSIAVHQAERKTGKAVNPSAKTIEEIIKSLTHELKTEAA